VQPPSPQPQPPPQPQQAVDFPLSLLQEAIDACDALNRIVEHLEYDKVAQALVITKLKRRVKKLEKRNNVRVLKLRRLQKVGTSQRVETSNDTVMDDESNQERMIAEMDQDDVVVMEDDKAKDKYVVDAVKDAKEAKVDKSAQVQGRQAESQAEIYKIDIDHANKVLSVQEDKNEPAKIQEVLDVQPPSPQPQPPPQPQQAVDFPLSLLQEAIDACDALNRIVEHLEYDKVAQALVITKLKRRVKKLEKRNNVRVLKLRRLQKVGTSQRVETSNDTVMDDESNQGRMIAEMDQDDVFVMEDDKAKDKYVVDAVKDAKEAKVYKSAQVQGRQAESQAEIYKIDIDHPNKVLSVQEDKNEPAKIQEVLDVVTTAKLITTPIIYISFLTLLGNFDREDLEAL
nr:hypothetical protein [Tanacetum cinerariifolium]